MRVLAFLASLAVAMATGSAHAAPGSTSFAGPPSGSWESYRVGFSTPLDSLFLSFSIDRSECFNGLSDERYTCLDSPDVNGGCDAVTACPAAYLRRVSFDATGVDFAFYIPRGFFFCQDFPPPGRQGLLCGDFFFNSVVYLDYEFSGPVPDIAIRSTGGGTVPEPASWALMVAGFGLTGAALRRRQAAVFSRASA